MKKRLLCLLLALVMTAAMLPASTIAAFAEGEVYTITVETVGSGTVEISSDTASASEYVTVKMTAGDGLFIKQMAAYADDVAFATINYNSPSFEEDTDGFTMPAHNVTLRVTFAAPSDFDTTPDNPTPHEPGEPCAVSFDANGGEGTMESTEVVYGDAYTLPECDFTKSNREFYKWEVNGIEYDAKDTILLFSDVTVKAIWSYGTQAYINDYSYDNSTTDIIGVLKLHDLRTDETRELTVIQDTAFSSFDQPVNQDVEQMTDDTKSILNDRLYVYGEIHRQSMTVSEPTVVAATDNRTFEISDTPGYDENGDYFFSSRVVEGDYANEWQITVTLEAEYTSVPMSYIHVLSSDGGYVDFWCEEYQGNYDQPYDVPEGAEVTLSAVSENGYEFLGWYKGDVNASSYDGMFTDELISTENPYVFNAEGYPYVCAKFTYTGIVRPQGDQIQVWVADGGTASVTYTPSVKDNPYIKPMDGTRYVSVGEVVQFWQGDEITVNAKPDAGYTFKGWYHVRIEWGPGDILPKYEGKPIALMPRFTYKPAVTVVEGDSEPLRYVCAVFEKSDGCLIGDVNADGTVNVHDVTQLQRLLAEYDTPSEAQKIAADINGNGELDIADATLLQEFLAEYPVAYPIATYQ